MTNRSNINLIRDNVEALNTRVTNLERMVKYLATANIAVVLAAAAIFVLG